MPECLSASVLSEFLILGFAPLSTLPLHSLLRCNKQFPPANFQLFQVDGQFSPVMADSSCLKRPFHCSDLAGVVFNDARLDGGNTPW